MVFTPCSLAQLTHKVLTWVSVAIEILNGPQLGSGKAKMRAPHAVSVKVNHQAGSEGGQAAWVFRGFPDTHVSEDAA